VGNDVGIDGVEAMLTGKHTDGANDAASTRMMCVACAIGISVRGDSGDSHGSLAWRGDCSGVCKPKPSKSNAIQASPEIFSGSISEHDAVVLHESLPRSSDVVEIHPGLPESLSKFIGVGESDLEVRVSTDAAKASGSVWQGLKMRRHFRF